MSIFCLIMVFVAVFTLPRWALTIFFVLFLIFWLRWNLVMARREQTDIVWTGLRPDWDSLVAGHGGQGAAGGDRSERRVGIAQRTEEIALMRKQPHAGGKARGIGRGQ